VTKGNKRIPESHTLPSVSEFFLTDDESFVSFFTSVDFRVVVLHKADYQHLFPSRILNLDRTY
jgi:hypothetical protein